MKICITDHPFKDLNIAKALIGSEGHELVLLDDNNRDELYDADAVLVGMFKTDELTIAKLTKCKIITRFGTGFDNIDIDAAHRHNIIVSNIPDFCMDEVSDHTVALLLACARHLPLAQQVVKNGKWGPPSMDINTFRRLKNQTLGLIGFGRIARLVAQKARAFGLDCLVYDPYVSYKAAEEARCTKLELAKVLETADYISLHLPLTSETAGIIDAETLRLMKPSAFVINTARGPLINQADLLDALDAGQIAGAALDVLYTEPPGEQERRLIDMPQVIVTPHIGWMSIEARDDMQTKGIEEVLRVLRGDQPAYKVN